MAPIKFFLLSVFVAILSIATGTMINPTTANAYFTVFGYKIPTSFNEIKEVIYGVPNNQPPSETSSGVILSKQTIIQDQANDFIKYNLYGKGISNSYVLETGKVDFFDGYATVNAKLKDGTTIYAEVKIDSTGKGLDITNLNITGTKFISYTETILKSVIKTYTPKLLKDYVPDFHHAEILENRLNVYTSSSPKNTNTKNEACVAVKEPTRPCQVVNYDKYDIEICDYTRGSQTGYAKYPRLSVSSREPSITINVGFSGVMPVKDLNSYARGEGSGSNVNWTLDNKPVNLGNNINSSLWINKVGQNKWNRIDLACDRINCVAKTACTNSTRSEAVSTIEINF